MGNAKLTQELLDELLGSSDIDGFLLENEMRDVTLSDYLSVLLGEKGLKKSSVIRNAGLNETFGYQIFSGDRHPGRDKVIRLAFSMNCSLIEANRLLKIAGLSELYCRDKRDAILIFCLTHGMNIGETDEELYAFNEPTLD